MAYPDGSKTFRETRELAKNTALGERDQILNRQIISFRLNGQPETRQPSLAVPRQKIDISLIAETEKSGRKQFSESRTFFAEPQCRFKSSPLQTDGADCMGG
jgi:hypothetical protein